MLAEGDKWRVVVVRQISALVTLLRRRYSLIGMAEQEKVCADILRLIKRLKENK